MLDKYKLKWEEFPTNLVTSFKDLRDENDFHDVTLLSQDLEQISAHKAVLAACSPYFKAILKTCRGRNPLICLDGIDKRDLQYILDFMYLGEVQFEEEYLDKFLQLANKLSLKGVSERDSSENVQVSAGEYHEEVKEEGKLKGVSEKENQEDMPSSETSVSQELEGTTIALKQEQKMPKNGKYKAEGENTNGKTIDDKINEFIVKSSTGELSCAFCGKKAFVKRVIKDHVETHIQGLGITCEFCGKELSTRASLRVHKYSYHRDMLMLNVK